MRWDGEAKNSVLKRAMMGCDLMFLRYIYNMCNFSSITCNTCRNYFVFFMCVYFWFVETNIIFQIPEATTKGPLIIGLINLLHCFYILLFNYLFFKHLLDFKVTVFTLR